MALLEGKAAQFALPAPKTMNSLDSQPSFPENHLPTPPAIYSPARNPRPAKSPVQLPEPQQVPADSAKSGQQSGGTNKAFQSQASLPVAQRAAVLRDSQAVTSEAVRQPPADESLPVPSSADQSSREPLLTRGQLAEQSLSSHTDQQQAQPPLTETTTAPSLQPPLKADATAADAELGPQESKPVSLPKVKHTQQAPPTRAAPDLSAAAEQSTIAANQQPELSAALEAKDAIASRHSDPLSFREGTAEARNLSAGILQEQQSLGSVREPDSQTQAAQQTEEDSPNTSELKAERHPVARAVETERQTAEPPFREEELSVPSTREQPVLPVSADTSANAILDSHPPSSSDILPPQPPQTDQPSEKPAAPSNVSESQSADNSIQRTPEAHRPVEDLSESASTAQPINIGLLEKAISSSAPPSAANDAVQPPQKAEKPAISAEAAQPPTSHAEAASSRQEAVKEQAPADRISDPLAVISPGHEVRGEKADRSAADALQTDTEPEAETSRSSEQRSPEAGPSFPATKAEQSFPLEVPLSKATAPSSLQSREQLEPQSPVIEKTEQAREISAEDGKESRYE